MLIFDAKSATQRNTPCCTEDQKTELIAHNRTNERPSVILRIKCVRQSLRFPFKKGSAQCVSIIVIFIVVVVVVVVATKNNCSHKI